VRSRREFVTLMVSADAHAFVRAEIVDVGMLSPRDGRAAGRESMVVPRGEKRSRPRASAFADELAPMVEVWLRLLTTHVPDDSGRCRACTAGGTGVPSEPWPCVIRGMAELARISHAAGAA
jgi:hypothetical protein